MGRLVAINGCAVHHKGDIRRCLDQARETSEETVSLHFGSRVSVLRSLEAAAGFTAADFLQRTVNNLYWWPFEYHVQHLSQAMIEGWQLRSDILRPLAVGLVVLAIAVALTGLSVLIFVLNRRAWERYLAEHSDALPGMGQTSAVSVLSRSWTRGPGDNDLDRARSWIEQAYAEEGVSTGPRPPSMMNCTSSFNAVQAVDFADARGRTIHVSSLPISFQQSMTAC